MQILSTSFGLLALIALISSSCTTTAQTIDVELVPAFPNLTFPQPTDIQNAGDGSNRLFVCEKTGFLHVFPNNPDVSETTLFLDLSTRVTTQSEMGLLGLAFHPNYEENGFFYVYYNVQRGNKLYTIISRFSVDSEDPNKADINSELVLMEIEQPFGNHDGGQIAFGPDDGYLYIALGDGGSGGDPLNSGQDLRSPLGKILRIDVDNTDGDKNYSIPATNPFATNSEYVQEIYAWGLRNPWRFSFDPPTGRLWAGDVGQDKWEEIDIIEKGGNYGWRVTEGWHCYNPNNNCDSIGLIGPVWEYSHSVGQSITGGYVYRGSNVPALEGMYIYGDFSSSRIWALDYQSPEDVSNILLTTAPLGVSTFGIDESNELYVTGFGSNQTNRKIYKFVDPSGNVEGGELNAEATLHPAIPNPARSRVTIPYDLDGSMQVSITIFNSIGEEIAQLINQKKEVGEHQVEFDTTEIPGGIYYVQLTTEKGQVTRKLTVEH
ncbi:MAG: PQQ-dependent sugar dehydrogenase [Candidatus Kapaibacterium sp.]